ncbi:MAG TPA: hypothetical protein PKI99_09405 [Terrimesophilobacter sp.]|nr:hypothetical protein [Terrimesophilobacter sp.]
MTKHVYIDGMCDQPGHIYYERDGARLRCEVLPEDVVRALDAWMDGLEKPEPAKSEPPKLPEGFTIDDECGDLLFYGCTMIEKDEMGKVGPDAVLEAVKAWCAHIGWAMGGEKQP